jgi:hypothetical protein
MCVDASFLSEPRPCAGDTNGCVTEWPIDMDAINGGDDRGLQPGRRVHMEGAITCLCVSEATCNLVAITRNRRRGSAAA